MRLLISTLALMMLAPVSVHAETTPLQDAYKKEFAFLEAEESLLKKRLVKLQGKTRSESSTQRVKLNGLQRRIVTKTTEADAMADKMVEIERQIESLGESTDALTDLAQQMSRSLESDGVAWAPKMAVIEGEQTEARLQREAAAINSGFEKALSGLAGLGMVRSEAGHFYLASGEQVKGTLIHVGRIAVYGVSGVHAGALTPAGNKSFKLDPVQGAETAKALHGKQKAANMGVFLFESTEKNFEPKREKTVQEVIESGGIIAWVIVSLGIFAMLLVVIRLFLLLLSGANTEKFWQNIEPNLKTRNLAAVESFCKSKRGAGARMLSALAPVLSHDREDVERVFAERMVVEEARLDRLGTLILVIAAIAPLLGLLGTVTGMISTFDVITEFGTGNPKLLSGGISEALVTTELGLCVAIPALLFGNILNGWAARMKGNLEYGALRMVNTVRCTAPGPDNGGVPNANTPWGTGKPLRQVAS
jgi:biopolymer transport protein ExbB